MKRYFRVYLQAPRGSRWYYGNFSIGLMVDSHPLFTNIIVGVGLFDVVLCWEFRE